MIAASPKLKAVLDLARAGQIDVSAAEVIVDTAVKDFGLEDAQLGDFVSLLAYLAYDAEAQHN